MELVAFKKVVLGGDMNVPAIAKNTFELLRNQPEFLSITQTVMNHLNKIKSSLERARFVHNMVDEYNKEVFAHPILKAMVPCKAGCSGCCHTQVSVTEDEAELLAHNISSNGLEINYERLAIQAEAGNDSSVFFKIPYAERRCVFLDKNGGCTVYKDRPSVCRTNAVVGDAAQCDTSVNPEGGSIRLVKTEKSDMTIVGAFAAASASGTLPFMLSKVLKAKSAAESIQPTKIKTILERFKGRKPVSKDHEL
jgi:Fe-S-cluster containining protein